MKIQKKLLFFLFWFSRSSVGSRNAGPWHYQVVSDSVLHGTMLIMNFSVLSYVYTIYKRHTEYQYLIFKYLRVSKAAHLCRMYKPQEVVFVWSGMQKTYKRKWQQQGVCNACITLMGLHSVRPTTKTVNRKTSIPWERRKHSMFTRRAHAELHDVQFHKTQASDHHLWTLLTCKAIQEKRYTEETR